MYADDEGVKCDSESQIFKLCFFKDFHEYKWNMNGSLRYNLHNIGYHCTKYEHPPSNNEGGVRISSR